MKKYAVIDPGGEKLITYVEAASLSGAMYAYADWWAENCTFPGEYPKLSDVEFYEFVRGEN